MKRFIVTEYPTQMDYYIEAFDSETAIMSVCDEWDLSDSEMNMSERFWTSETLKTSKQFAIDKWIEEDFKKWYLLRGKMF